MLAAYEQLSLFHCILGVSYIRWQSWSCQSL